MDKKIEEFFGITNDAKDKDVYLKTQDQIGHLIASVNNGISKAKSKVDVDKIETYMSVVQEFLQYLKDKRDFIVIKAIAKKISETNDKMLHKFSEEGINNQLDAFQKKIDKKSREYERM